MGPTGKYTTSSAQASMKPAELDEDGGSECTSTCMDLLSAGGSAGSG
jgi:hypothetical protein